MRHCQQSLRPARLIFGARTAVDGGERAIMYDRIRGVLEEPVGEGTHFRVPWLQTPNIMDIRTRPRTISSVTGTKGGLSRWPSTGSSTAHHPCGCIALHVFACLPVCWVVIWPVACDQAAHVTVQL